MFARNSWLTSLTFLSFLGLVTRLDAAVQLSVDNLTTLRLLLNDSSIRSLVIISFRSSRQILFQHQTTGLLSSGSDDSLKRVRVYFTENGNSIVDLFDSNLLIRSLAYDHLQKRLYLLKPDSLVAFDLARGKWNDIQLKSERIVVRNGGSRSLSTEESPSIRIKFILYASGQLYAQVDSGDKLSPMEMQTDGQTLAVKSKVEYTWKELFNCYHNSPLVWGGELDYDDDGRPHQYWRTTKRQPLKPLQTVHPSQSNSSQPLETNHAVVIIIVIVVALILFFGAIVYCRYIFIKIYFWLLNMLFLLYTTVSMRAFLAAKESTSDTERARDLERQFKLEDLSGSSATTSRSKLLVSPAESRRNSTDSPNNPEEESSWTLTSFVRNVFGQKKPSKRKRKKRSSTSLSSSDSNESTYNSSDYSSKLNLFNPSSINISRSMASGTSLWSHRQRSKESLKTIRISSNCGLESSPMEPVKEVPCAELATRRLFKLSYSVSGVRGPGGFKLTGPFQRELMLNKKLI